MKGLALTHRELGEAISREVHYIPVVIDYKVVNQLGLAGSGGRHSQATVAAEHVDQAGFADVGAPDEGEFGEPPGGFSLHPGTAHDEFGLRYLHISAKITIIARFSNPHPD